MQLGALQRATTISKKVCTKCGAEKPLAEYHRDKSKSDGLRTTCKACKAISDRAWAKNNPTKRQAIQKRYYQKNKKEIYRKNRNYVLQNLEKYREAFKRYKKRHPGKVNACNMRRYTKKLQACPKWLSKEQIAEITEIYTLAKDLSWLSEEPLHVDHIVPLRSKSVCGLHVPWNLQILPAGKNIRKSNKF